MKRVLCVLAAVMLAFTVAVTAFADNIYVNDSSLTFYEEELTKLENMGGYLFAETGIKAVFEANNTLTEDEITRYVQSLYSKDVSGKTVALVINTELGSFDLGCPDGLFSVEELQDFSDAFFNGGGTYYDGVCAYFEAVRTASIAHGYEGAGVVEYELSGIDPFGVVEDEALPFEEQELLESAPYNPVNAFDIPEPEHRIPSERLQPRLLDGAGIISDSKEEEITRKLDELSEKYKFDFAVVTAATTYGKEPMDFADDYYDYNGFGQGKNRDGVLLLISMDPRMVWISTCGKGTKAISTSDTDEIIDLFFDDVVNAEFDNVPLTFADGAVRELKSFRTNPLKLLVVAVIIGFIIASGMVSSMRKKLKSVHLRAAAPDYVAEGGLKLLMNDDRLVDSIVNKSVKAQTTSGGGSRTGGSGGGIHTSSSGTSHGGGGRRF